MRLLLAAIIFFSFWGNVCSAQDTVDIFYQKAKEKCNTIESIRSQMDRINNEILRLLAERTAYVKRAGDLKSQTTKIADDRKRVADQKNKISKKSIELGLPEEISIPVFTAIMEHSIRYQQSYINQLILD